MSTNLTLPSIDSRWHDPSTNTDWRVQSIFKSNGTQFIRLASAKDGRISRRFPIGEWPGKHFERIE